MKCEGTNHSLKQVVKKHVSFIHSTPTSECILHVSYN